MKWSHYVGGKRGTHNPDTVSSDPRFDSTKSADDPYSATDDPKKSEQERCYYEGSVWCDGGYHGGARADGTGTRGQQPSDRNKGYSGSSVYMLFGTGSAVNSIFIKKGETQKFKYEAVISGPDGTCRCTWEVLITVDPTGRVIDNRVLDVQCTNS